MGIPDLGVADRDAAARAAAGVTALTRSLALPQRLRDVGVERSQLGLVAAQMLKSPAVRDNPRPVPDVATALELLESAW
jgi:alcohol dehydrogenase class IV